MKVLSKAILVSLVPFYADAIAVGDEVCITGYMMDQFCINRGTFLDDPDTETLKFPEKHSFHCLLDVPVCQEGGYTVLGPKNEDTDEHCIAYQIHSDETQKVLDAGFPYGNGVADNGYCTGCTGDDSRPSFGWVATVKGIVVEMGQENGVNALASPVIGSVEILDNTVECENYVDPPTCGRSLGPSEPAEAGAPAEPTTNDEVVEPATNDEVVEPATNDEVAEPATNDEVVEPATNDEVAEPATNDEVVEPATNDEVSDPEPAPAAEDPVEEPAEPSSAKILGVSSALSCILLLCSAALISSV